MYLQIRLCMRSVGLGMLDTKQRLYHKCGLRIAASVSNRVASGHSVENGVMQVVRRQPFTSLCFEGYEIRTCESFLCGRYWDNILAHESKNGIGTN